MPFPTQSAEAPKTSGKGRFQCHICGESSERICPRCTRDACENHLCERCGRCSDCCECEMTAQA